MHKGRAVLSSSRPNNHNSMADKQVTTSRIMALCPGGRAIGMALSDRLGLVKTGILRLPSKQSGNEKLERTKIWFAELMLDDRPDYVVMEKLPRFQKHRTALMLSGLLESLVEQHGIHHLDRAPKQAAVTWLCTKSRWKTDDERRPSVRLAAQRLSVDEPDFFLHPPRESKIRTEWDRTHGQAATAAALALFAQPQIPSSSNPKTL